jgi:hypothetical protein
LKQKFFPQAEFEMKRLSDLIESNDATSLVERMFWSDSSKSQRQTMIASLSKNGWATSEVKGKITLTGPYLKFGNDSMMARVLGYVKADLKRGRMTGKEINSSIKAMGLSGGNSPWFPGKVGSSSVELVYDSGRTGGSPLDIEMTQGFIVRGQYEGNVQIRPVLKLDFAPTTKGDRIAPWARR